MRTISHTDIFIDLIAYQLKCILRVLWANYDLSRFQWIRKCSGKMNLVSKLEEHCIWLNWYHAKLAKSLARFCPKVSCDQNLSGRNILINFLLTKSPSLQKNCSDLLYLQAKLNIKTGPDRWLTLNFLVVIHVFDVKYCVITSAFSQKITVL